jgi:hypothetical protein
MIAIIPIVLLLIAGSSTWYFMRTSSILQKWADDHGYRICRKRYCYFKGPFFLSAGKRPVYRVIVQDSTGRTRRGYVQCGSWALGLTSDQVAVRWDT